MTLYLISISIPLLPAIAALDVITDAEENAPVSVAALIMALDETRPLRILNLNLAEIFSLAPFLSPIFNPSSLFLGM